MTFDSAFYLFCFFPLLLLIHGLFRNVRARNGLLLAVGLIFYSFGSLSGLVLLLAASLVNWLLGLGLMGQRGRKVLAVAGVTANLAFLGAYKYLDFLLSQLNGLFGSAWETGGLIAPIGISFFTFKCISYLIDVYRQPQRGTRRFDRLLLYISFFPQLMAGPITRWPDFSAQLAERPRGAEQTARGLRRMILGFGKKLILSAAMGALVDGVFALGAVQLDFRLAWLAAIAYTLQIYFDFSGYSDMAIGLGQIFGFVTPENFDYPYTASSITEFWRRWHISLSSWFRDYLYIPLGGSRKGKVRAAVNKFIVFALCGLWHGAAWTYILWGAWHGLFSALESLGAIPVRRLGEKRVGRVVSRVYTLLVVCLGFVMFRAANVGEGLRILAAMFTAFRITPASTVALHSLVSGEFAAMLLLCLLGCLPQWRRLYLRLEGRRAAAAVSWILAVVLFLLCMLKLAAGGFTPFIYFQF